MFSAPFFNPNSTVMVIIYVCGCLFRKAFMFNLHKTCYTCSRPIFQYKFNGGACFGIRLTKKGNLLVLYVFCTVFQCEFNRDGHYVIQKILQLHNMIWTWSSIFFQCKCGYDILQKTNLVHYII